jgi:hypothetical protein
MKVFCFYLMMEIVVESSSITEIPSVLPFFRNMVPCCFFHIGYAKLNDYCHKLNITKSANCQCGERETVEHYILHCDQYEEAREKLIHVIGGH